MKYAVAMAVLALATASAQAEPVRLPDNALDSVTAGAGVGQALQAQAALLGLNNVGELISGVIYGNTSNPSGNGNGVLPSLSPGPWKCANALNCAGPTAPGGSMGEFIAPIVSGGAASPDFANSKSPGPDFSLH